jgi:hypothetical protein
MIADLAMQRALDRLDSVGFERLSEEDQILATIWFFESRVANGGFAHFFKSAEGYLAPHAPAAFRAIGAESLADIAESANAVFGPAGVPRGKKDRADYLRTHAPDAHRVFDQLEERYFESAPDLGERLEAYLASRAAFSP